MRYYAYHRTSTEEQHLDRGLIAIENFCNDKDIKLDHMIYTDQCTGKNFNRPSYKDMFETIEYLVKVNNEKVTLIITELDRLGRNKQLTIKEINKLRELEVRLMVLEIPTTLIELPNDTSLANMMMETINNMLIEMYVSFAHAEMEKRANRQKEGIAAKKKRGEWDDYGRPRLKQSEEFPRYYEKVLKGELKPGDVMKILGIKKPTYYKYAKEYNEGLA